MLDLKIILQNSHLCFKAFHFFVLFLIWPFSFSSLSFGNKLKSWVVACSQLQNCSRSLSLAWESKNKIKNWRFFAVYSKLLLFSVTVGESVQKEHLLWVQGQSMLASEITVGFIADYSSRQLYIGPESIWRQTQQNQQELLSFCFIASKRTGNKCASLFGWSLFQAKIKLQKQGLKKMSKDGCEKASDFFVAFCRWCDRVCKTSCSH